MHVLDPMLVWFDCKLVGLLWASTFGKHNDATFAEGLVAVIEIAME